MAGETDKNSQIEMLRAVAIVYTLIHHLPIVLGPLPKYFDGLYKNADFSIGVDLFFVISGFVITRSLGHSVAEFEAPRWRLMVAFWLKRVFRLLPLAWLWLLITALFMLVLEGLPNTKEHAGVLFIPVLASWLQVANLYSAYCLLPTAYCPRGTRDGLRSHQFNGPLLESLTGGAILPVLSISLLPGKPETSLHRAVRCCRGPALLVAANWFFCLVFSY